MIVVTHVHVSFVKICGLVSVPDGYVPAACTMSVIMLFVATVTFHFNLHSSQHVRLSSSSSSRLSGRSAFGCSLEPVWVGMNTKLAPVRLRKIYVVILRSLFDVGER
jgi:hypothetical protein